MRTAFFLGLAMLGFRLLPCQKPPNGAKVALARDGAHFRWSWAARLTIIAYRGVSFMLSVASSGLFAFRCLAGS